MAAEPPRPLLVYLVTSLNPGGAEWGLVHLLRHGGFEGFEVQVWALARGAGAQVEALAALGHPPRLLHDATRLTPAVLAAAAARLALRLRRARPAVLVLSLPHANLLGRLLRPADPAPLVVSFEHNSRLARRAYELGYRATSGRVDWALADCRATAEAALARNYRRPPPRLDILPLVAFPPDRLAAPLAASTAGGPFRLVSAGRLARAKDQARMVGLLATLRRMGLDVRLTLYGEGPLRAELASQAARLGIADRLELAGQTHDWQRRPADLFLLTSRHEGLCLAALEAMAAGLPVAATPVGGLADYGAEAEVLPLGPDDAVNARAIAALLQAPERRARMAAAGRSLAARRYGEAQVRAVYADFAARLRQAAQARAG